MSTLELNVPIAQAQPGLIVWISAMAHSASAIDWATVPASVIGLMAPASVNGVTMVGWPRLASRIMPSIIGQSCLRGEVELMLVYMRGVASNSAWLRPPTIRTISMTSSTRSVPSE